MFFSKLSRAGRRLGTVCAVAFAVLSGPVAAQSYGTLRVFNDGGGDLIHRVQFVNQLRSTGRPIEIRSGYCNSACTLYLGLPQTCIGRGAMFGFHGPRSGITGAGLPQSEFEYWTRVMASYYPSSLQSWFLSTGRHRLNGIYRISGADLINMGVRECA